MSGGTPGRTRTCGQPLRRRLLYPLSYWGAVVRSFDSCLGYPLTLSGGNPRTEETSSQSGPTARAATISTEERCGTCVRRLAAAANGPSGEDRSVHYRARRPLQTSSRNFPLSRRAGPGSDAELAAGLYILGRALDRRRAVGRALGSRAGKRRTCRKRVPCEPQSCLKPGEKAIRCNRSDAGWSAPLASTSRCSSETRATRPIDHRLPFGSPVMDSGSAGETREPFRALDLAAAGAQPLGTDPSAENRHKTGHIRTNAAGASV